MYFCDPGKWQQLGNCAGKTHFRMFVVFVLLDTVIAVVLEVIEQGLISIDRSGGKVVLL